MARTVWTYLPEPTDHAPSDVRVSLHVAGGSLDADTADFHDDLVNEAPGGAPWEVLRGGADGPLAPLSAWDWYLIFVGLLLWAGIVIGIAGLIFGE